jgi:hypothetical protein
MMQKILVIAASLALLMASPLWAAQSSQKQGGDLNSRLASMISSGLFLTVSCDMPVIQPTMPYLKRSGTLKTDNLITNFFGDSKAITKEETIKNSLWGKGRRMKTSVGAPTINIGSSGDPSLQKTLAPKNKNEQVPVYMDLFPYGFIYANNIPHKPVRVTDVKMENNVPKNVGYHNIYSEKEGQRAAESLVAQMCGKLSVPAGFQSAVKPEIRTTGERLFALRVNPEYITSYETVNKNKQKSKKSIAIPVYDVYTLVVLDGDKMLAGMEYFWDGGIAVSGKAAKCIYAGQAVDNARAGLPKLFGGNPPLLTVTQIRLGYVQDRKDTSRLIPAWLFDAWYTRFTNEQPQGNARASSRHLSRSRSPLR